MSKKILFISGSVGLGHVTRDLAIARAIRLQIPDVEIVWLAGEPANRYLEQKGVRLLPDRYQWNEETSVIENVSDGTRLNVIKYMLNVQKKVWPKHVALFREIMQNERFDLVIGDETYALSIAIKDGRLSPNTPFIMIYDFIGVDATGHNPLEKLAAYITNRRWTKTKHRSNQPIRSLFQFWFVGQAEDIPDKPFGFRLPNRRKWTQKHYQLLGYVLPFDPDEYRDKEKIKATLGYDEHPLIICSVGGTNVGKQMLHLCIDAFHILKEKVPQAQMVLVCGPRIDPAAVPETDGLQVKGLVPDLYRHFAACDLALIQGGNTSTIELTALRRPFIYFPIEDHFEQTLIEERQKRLGAGVPMKLSTATPEMVAEKMIETMNQPINYADIPTDGAQKAAQLVKELLGVETKNQSTSTIAKQEMVNKH